MPRASGVTIAVLGQPVEACTFHCIDLFTKIIALGSVALDDGHRAMAKEGQVDDDECGVPVARGCSLQWEGAGTVAER